MKFSPFAGHKRHRFRSFILNPSFTNLFRLQIEEFIS